LVIEMGTATPFPDIVPELKIQMPELKGDLAANRALVTSFGVGGPAQVLFTAKDEGDLVYFLTHLPADIPVTIIGFGFNVLVRDGGIEGVVIQLDRTGDEFRRIDVKDEVSLVVGAAASNADIARRAQECGIAGFSFLCGIPGGLGGSLRMNSGGYGGEIKDVLVSARAVDRQGRLHVLTNENMEFRYRHCGAPEDYIFTQATLLGKLGNRDEIAKKTEDVQKRRKEQQPINQRSGGSTFKNPPGLIAWELIHAADCQELRSGNAYVSERHCNFLINPGNATAYDIETLGETVRLQVKEALNVELEWEIKRLGMLPSSMGVRSIAEFIQLIETNGEEGAAETFVMMARGVAAEGDRTRLRHFFEFYFPRLQKKAQVEVACFFCEGTLFGRSDR
jgi:UDP-N-acetylmuramate dehydrogenase